MGRQCLVWYSVDLSELSSDAIRSKFIQMFEDDETKLFIKESVEQSDSWLLQVWYNLAKSIMKLFSYTLTDMNGYLKRGSMFVLSQEQFNLLLGHGNVQLHNGTGWDKMLITAVCLHFFEKSDSKLYIFVQCPFTLGPNSIKIPV